MLAPVDESALAGFQAVIREASNVTTGTMWEIADVEDVGRRLVAEVEILRARPVVPALLDLIEQAIAVWDELAGHLIDAYYARRIDPRVACRVLKAARQNGSARRIRARVVASEVWLMSLSLSIGAR